MLQQLCYFSVRTLGINFVDTLTCQATKSRVITHSLSTCLSWFEGLELPSWLFQVGQLVTKTYCVAARTSPSSIKYLFSCLNKSSIVAVDFLVIDLKNGVPRQMLLLKVCKMASMLQDSTWSTTYLNHFTNSLKDSFSCILRFCKVLMFCLWRVEQKQCPTKASDRSPTIVIEFFGRRCNHERA